MSGDMFGTRGRVLDAVMSRRTFLGYGAMAAAAAALAACGGGRTGPSPTGTGSRLDFGDLDFITIANWGGSTAQAMETAWGKPFTAETGVEVRSAAMDYGKLRAQVESGNVTWYNADAEGYFVFGHPELLEPLDYDTIGLTKDDLVDPELLQPNGVSNYLYSFVIGYRTDAEGPHPTTWEEFFDTKGIPGKRSLYNWPYGTLEIALLGDGVPFDELYPLDIQRAFAKIDSIRDDLVWWNTGAESQQFLVSQAADFVVGWNPRFGYLALGGLPVAIEWNQNFRAASHHVVPKGVPSPEAAMEYIRIATQPQAQADFSQLAGGLGCPVKAANDLLPESLRPWVPTTPENLAVSIGAQDDRWWGENFERVATEWASFVGA